MKSQYLTRILIFIMILLLLVPSFGCSNKGESVGKGKDKTQEGTQKTGEGDGLEFVTFDWYVPMSPMPDTGMVNDAVNDYLKEKINANVNMYYWSGSDWEEKMPTMLGSGQDLGIVAFGSNAKVDYVVQSTRGSFLAIDELLNNHAKEAKALFPGEVWDAMRVGGKIYGIPSLKDNSYILSIIYNADMAEALGIDMDKVDYRNWRNIEPFLEEVLLKRSEKFPEYDIYPVSETVVGEVPYNFAVETFLSSYFAVCNINPFNDVEGFDDNTVFNLYATDEYREFCKSRQRMVKKNIFAYEWKSEWIYTGGVFCCDTWGRTFMPEHLYGDEYVTKMLTSKNIWRDTSNFHSAGTAISVNCSQPERAMMLLNLVNTDPDFATMMRFGIENKHYIINNEGKMQFEGSERNVGETKDFSYYYWYAPTVGNLTIVNAPEDLTGPDNIMLKEMNRFNNAAVSTRHFGFTLDTTPIINEIAACTNVVQEFAPVLRSGKLETVAEIDQRIDEFNGKLKANGLEKIIREIQSQVDKWNSNR